MNALVDFDSMRNIPCTLDRITVHVVVGGVCEWERMSSLLTVGESLGIKGSPLY